MEMKMNIHECMKCRFYLTHFDDMIICVRHEDNNDLQSLIVTVKRNDSTQKECLMFIPENGVIN